MLLNFYSKNFKSFRNGFSLSMKPTKLKDLNDSILKYTSNNLEKKALSSSVIYGPNASGKTTLIEAINCFKKIVLNGGISSVDNNLQNKANNFLMLVPFIYSQNLEPVEFEIEFSEKNNDEYNEYRYGLKLILGNFFDTNIKQKIIEEYLYIDNKEIFIRNNKSVDVFYKKISKASLNNGLSENMFDNFLNIMRNNLEDTKLFLSTDFASFVSKEIYNNIFNWLSNKLQIFIEFSNLNYTIQSEKNKNIKLPNYIFKAVNQIGVIGSELIYVKSEKNENDVVLVSKLKTGDNREIAIPSRLIESLGTLKFIDLFPAVLISLLSGSTLIIDELDSSLHPMVIMSIINIFHDPEINKYNAQLVFNTHNPIYLNNKLFRRDEMCFVEKDKDTKISEFYKLSDFKTNSSNPTRNTTDYINGYFKNKYGAIEYVNLSEICYEIINQFYKGK